MIKKLYILILLSVLSLTGISYATACGCGSNKSDSNVSLEQQTQQQDVAKEKVQCPVMKTWILPSEAADKTDYNGKTYYFCCGGCKEQFLKNPDQYINSETKS